MRLVPGVLVAALLVIPRSGLAQASEPEPEFARFFFDANLAGGTSAARGRGFRSTFVRFGEVGSADVAYPKPSLSNPLAALDVGGGVMISRMAGVGVSYGRTPYRNAVQLSTTIPHPTVLYSLGTDTRLSAETLKRDETAVHVLFIGMAPLPFARSELRIAGGPSFFRYRADMVQTVLYDQAYDALTPKNTITINGLATQQARENAIGFNVGGDFNYFFTRTFGVGTGVRFSWATVDVEREPLSDVAQRIRVGSTLGFVGVRFRFGG
jgi:hypothetical protein